MSDRTVPLYTTRGRTAVAVTADQLATQAAMWAFARGGNAVDAAIAANAAIAVTGPHLCGMGGDLFALVMSPNGDVHALNASGRAGSGADAAAMRDEGLTCMPLRHDVRSVTVPGCVDGWVALHERFGSIALELLLTPAIRMAAAGFAASPLLAAAVAMLDDAGRAELYELHAQATHPGAVVRRPGVALALQAIARGGRDAFYDGAFGEGLIALGAGLFSEADVLASQATWVDPLRTDVFGVELCTIPPNSQGYLTLGIARLSEEAGLPETPDDEMWAHLLIEASTAASHDRPAMLADGADGVALLDEVCGRGKLVDREAASRRSVPVADGDTTYLCTADRAGFAVSLIQSNASGFGSWLVEPTTGINLHNRGFGFSLERGHRAELTAGRRPPHTLSPALARRDGSLAAVLGTMGGDAQPQILAQIVARLFRHDESPAQAVAAPRWVLRGPATGFDTWTAPTPPSVVIEEGSPRSWVSRLAARGHDVAIAPAFEGSFGHANVIVAEPNGTFAATADPRARIGSAAAT
jgi:gamma-glutamyltranspeptidase/glutathione hydrolase